MAILGTLSTAFFTNMKERKMTFFLNGVMKNTGNVTYTTGDVITLMANEAPTVTFDTISLHSGVEKLTNYAQQKIAEFRITATEPFHIIINETFTSYPSQPSSFDSWEYISLIQAANCDVGIGDDKAVFIGCNWLNSPIKITARNGFKISNIERTNQNAPIMTISPDGKEANGIVATWGNATRFLKPTTVADNTPVIDTTVKQSEIDTLKTQGFSLYVTNKTTLTKAGDVYVNGTTFYIKPDNVDVIIDSVILNSGNRTVPIVANYGQFQYTTSMGQIALIFTITSHETIYKVFQSDIDYVNANFSKLYVNDILATSETTLKAGYEIKVVANSGRKYFVNEDFSSVFATAYEGSSVPLSPDEKSAKFDIKQNALKYPMDFAIETVLITPDTIKGVNNVYKLTNEQVKTIISTTFTDDTLPLEPKPIGNLIIGLLELPFDIPPSMNLGNQNISLGGFNTGINALALNDEKLIVDMGVISVPKNKDNLLDFKNTNVFLNLPYFEKIFLEPSDTIGYEITITMIVNLYDSMATVNVYSSKSNKIIVTKNVDLKMGIPFGDVEIAPKNNNPHDVTLSKDNGIKTPFIEVIRNNTLLENGLFTIPIIDENLIGVNTGYVEIDNVALKVKASSNEKQMIENVLKSGVIIK